MVPQVASAFWVMDERDPAQLSDGARKPIDAFNHRRRWLACKVADRRAVGYQVDLGMP